MGVLDELYAVMEMRDEVGPGLIGQVDGHVRQRFWMGWLNIFRHL